MPQTPSTRWCPTPEQLMILEEMYGSGVRNPNAAQIQQITAHLSLYGKIECKNVFYWFQNHKARDRQKQLRLMSSSLHHVPPHQEMNLVGKLEGGGDQGRLDTAAASGGAASSFAGAGGSCCGTPRTLDLFPVTKTTAGVKDDECSSSKSTKQ